MFREEFLPMNVKSWNITQNESEEKLKEQIKIHVFLRVSGSVGQFKS